VVVNARNLRLCSGSKKNSAKKELRHHGSQGRATCWQIRRCAAFSRSFAASVLHGYCVLGSDRVRVWVVAVEGAGARQIVLKSLGHTRSPFLFLFSFPSAADVLAEFLEVACQQLLYLRGVYPRQIFENKSKYGIMCQYSRLPELNVYINDVLQSAMAYVRKKVVASIVLVIMDRTRQAVERYVFEVLQPCLVLAFSVL
jgi:hypothetical protein